MLKPRSVAQAPTREKASSLGAEPGDEDANFKPLTAQQAAQWRSRQPHLSVWRVVVMQALAGFLLALLAWLLTKSAQIAWSVGYGALSVVVPAALFARGMVRKRNSAGAALTGLMGWELVKIIVTVAMLAAAPRLVPGLSWPALLVGMVVTMKTYWIALLARSGVRRTD